MIPPLRNFSESSSILDVPGQLKISLTLPLWCINESASLLNLMVFKCDSIFEWIIKHYLRGLPRHQYVCFSNLGPYLWRPHCCHRFLSEIIFRRRHEINRWNCGNKLLFTRHCCATCTQKWNWRKNLKICTQKNVFKGQLYRFKSLNFLDCVPKQ